MAVQHVTQYFSPSFTVEYLKTNKFLKFCPNNLQTLLTRT